MNRERLKLIRDSEELPIVERSFSIFVQPNQDSDIRPELVADFARSVIEETITDEEIRRTQRYIIERWEETQMVHGGTLGLNFPAIALGNLDYNTPHKGNISITIEDARLKIGMPALAVRVANHHGMDADDVKYIGKSIIVIADSLEYSVFGWKKKHQLPFLP